MAKNNHAKGSAWRRRIEVLLQEHGFTTSFRPIGVAGDDIRVDTEPVLSVEAKNHANYEFGKWVDQSLRQCPAHAVPVVWAHRRGRSRAEDGYVVLTGANFVRLLESMKDPRVAEVRERHSRTFVRGGLLTLCQQCGRSWPCPDYLATAADA